MSRSDTATIARPGKETTDRAEAIELYAAERSRLGAAEIETDEPAARAEGGRAQARSGGHQRRSGARQRRRDCPAESRG